MRWNCVRHRSCKTGNEKTSTKRPKHTQQKKKNNVRKEMPQGTDWFEEVARRLATDEDFVKVYLEDMKRSPFTERAQKEIAEWLKSGDDIFDYLLGKYKREGKQ